MSSFADFLLAAEKGAGAIYHQVLATGAEIHTWTESPAVAPLVAAGVELANGLLERVGISHSTLAIIEADIHTALKVIAAADPTVPSYSLSALTGLGARVATALVPGAAPIATGAAAVVTVGEGIAKTIAGIRAMDVSSDERADS